jgi:chromosome segregation ATPase
LKPEHSKVLKEKETVIKEIVQKYSKLELEFERSEDDLRLVREERSREKNHHEHTLQKLEEKRARVDELVGQLWEFERHNKAIKERALADVARVEEQLAIARDNHQQQSNRVVEKQRQNYQLGDAMRAHAKISEARKVEIEMLRKQLQDAQAELGIVKDIEELDDDVVEVGRREVVRGEVVKSEVIKGEAVKDEVIKGEAVKGEVV